MKTTTDKRSLRHCVIPVVLVLVFILAASGCNDQHDVPGKETLQNGTTTVYCDAAVDSLILPMLERYRATHPNAHLQLTIGDARSGMAQLLGAKTRMAVISRPYLKDEDSLMRVFHVKTHRSFDLATDALVFFTRTDSRIDTLSVEALHDRLALGKELTLHIQGLHSEPAMIVPSVQSAITANLQTYCSDGREFSKNANLRFCGSLDSVKHMVSQDPNAIGVAYLSQVLADSARFKLLRIWHYDKDSNRCTEAVHQSSVYRELYPFPVKIRVYLLEDLQNLPMGVATYLAYEPEPQRFFLNKGIVPAYAKIQLYEEQ